MSQNNDLTVIDRFTIFEQLVDASALHRQGLGARAG